MLYGLLGKPNQFVIRLEITENEGRKLEVRAAPSGGHLVKLVVASNCMKKLFGLQVSWGIIVNSAEPTSGGVRHQEMSGVKSM